jgi:hypothetical protein
MAIGRQHPAADIHLVVPAGEALEQITETIDFEASSAYWRDSKKIAFGAGARRPFVV